MIDNNDMRYQLGDEAHSRIKSGAWSRRDRVEGMATIEEMSDLHGSSWRRLALETQFITIPLDRWRNPSQ
jgi:hypothetical protein